MPGPAAVAITLTDEERLALERLVRAQQTQQVLARRARFTAEEVCQLLALACEPPREADRPISQWSGRELADEAISRGIVTTLSARHAARLLNRGICGRIAVATG
ncbi:MAG: hypothetical protein ACYDCQ_18845 [Dehalococcoidia bacterium]